MKRLLSMLLAVMLIATLGAVTAFAGPHEDHFIEFTGAVEGKITLEAIVGQPFNHTFAVSKCGGEGDYGVTFSVDGPPLPGWLELDEEDGTITGTPPEGTAGTPIGFLIKVVANEPCGGAALDAEVEVSITVNPAPETITWEIPYTKRVARGGSRNPGPETFTLEISGVGDTTYADEVTIVGNTGRINTNGSGDYSDYVSVTAPADALAEGFKVKETPGNDARWTYSDDFYTIWPVTNPDSGAISGFKIYEGYYGGDEDEGSTECERMTFTNTYTYSPSRDRDDDDDDDDDRPVREPEAEEEPREEEVQSNPDTGRGTPWDYLVYLFHKYIA